MKRLVLLIGLFVVGQGFVSMAKGAVGVTSTAEELNIAETVKSGETTTPKVKAGEAGKTNVTEPGKGATAPSGPPKSVVDANMGDVNVTRADVNATKEPNAESLQARMVEDLEKVFKDVKQAGQKERHEWLRIETKEGIGLAKAVENQVLDELKVLRKIAVEEKAVKMTAAIDMLIADRKERYEKIIERMEAEEEKARRQKQLRDERSRDRDRTPQRTQERR